VEYPLLHSANFSGHYWGIAGGFAEASVMYRNTRQYDAIGRVFEETLRPLRPEEVFLAAKACVGGLGIATVHRALKSLVEEGRVKPVKIPGRSVRYESALLGPHHHFYCETCTKVFDVPASEDRVGAFCPPGFVVASHEIFLFGVCFACSDPVAYSSPAGRHPQLTAHHQGEQPEAS
jgi:Fur family ferric uptake transcriptional regulator